MNPRFIKVPNAEGHSFRISNEISPHFYNPFHYHPELELTYVIQSTGIRFVGSHTERFGPGDLVLVGANLPHCWKNDPEYFDEDSGLEAQAIVIQFTQDFAGERFFQIPEFLAINRMITDARRGIRFPGKSSQSIKKLLFELVDSKGIDRIVLLIKTLDLMAQSREKEILCHVSSAELMGKENLDRLNAIFEYTTKNFKESIPLEKICAIANLSPNAFCRYFKLHTRKTYREFVNELRLSNICKQLQETTLGVGQIAYSNGFNNLAHFNRTFKGKIKMSPMEYRNQFKNLELFEQSINQH